MPVCRISSCRGETSRSAAKVIIYQPCREAIFLSCLREADVRLVSQRRRGCRLRLRNTNVARRHQTSDIKLHEEVASHRRHRQEHHRSFEKITAKPLSLSRSPSLRSRTSSLAPTVATFVRSPAAEAQNADPTEQLQLSRGILRQINCQKPSRQVKRAVRVVVQDWRGMKHTTLLGSSTICGKSQRHRSQPKVTNAKDEKSRAMLWE
jgi:hypothetical protein